MSDPIVEPFSPLESRLAGRVRDYAERGVVDFNAVDIAHGVSKRASASSLTATLRFVRPSRSQLAWIVLATLLVLGSFILFQLAGAIGRPPNPLLLDRGGSLFELDPDTSLLMSLGAGSQPQWSPDKSRIAFALPGPAVVGNSAWLMAPDGSHRRRFGNVDQLGYWSPDGKSMLAADPSIEIVPVDGGTPLVLGFRPSTTTEGCCWGTWAPDGHHVALVLDEPVASGDLVAFDVSASGLGSILGSRRLLHSGGLPWQVQWSPDGSAIAFGVITDDGAGSVRLVAPDGSNDHVLVPSGAGYIRWSPDGQRLAYYTLSAGPNCGTSPYECRLDVDVVDVRSGRITVVFTGGPGERPSWSWSRDGRRLAVVVRPFNGGLDPKTGEALRPPTSTIWIVDAAGAGARPLLRADDLEVVDW